MAMDGGALPARAAVVALMRGRKPVPTAMKILRGNPGRRPLNAHEPQPQAPVDLTPPAWLPEDARIEWADKAPMLQRLGLLTEADLDAFCLYCQAFARWKAAEKKLLEFGMVIKSSSHNGFPIVSPYLQIASKAQQQATRMLIEFGLTPSSRSRVSFAVKPKIVDPEKAKYA
jgi:P27 family predicted phage terminase small subunit